MCLYRYAPDSKSLPPHLSPFVDNDAEGYQPTYAAEVESLRKMRSAASASAAGSMIRGVKAANRARTAADNGVGAESSSGESDDESEPVRSQLVALAQRMLFSKKMRETI